MPSIRELCSLAVKLLPLLQFAHALPGGPHPGAGGLQLRSDYLEDACFTKYGTRRPCKSLATEHKTRTMTNVCTTTSTTTPVVTETAVPITVMETSMATSTTTETLPTVTSTFSTTTTIFEPSITTSITTETQTSTVFTTVIGFAPAERWAVMDRRQRGGEVMGSSETKLDARADGDAGELYASTYAGKVYPTKVICVVAATVSSSTTVTQTAATSTETIVPPSVVTTTTETIISTTTFLPTPASTTTTFSTTSTFIQSTFISTVTTTTVSTSTVYEAPVATGKLRVDRADGTGTLGYLSKSFFNGAQARYQAIEEAATVTYTGLSIDEATGQLKLRITMSPAQSDFSVLSLIQGRDSSNSDLAPGSKNYLYFGTSNGTPAGSRPALEPNSYSAATGTTRTVESDVFTMNVGTNEITAQWINTEGDLPQTFLFAQSTALYAGGDQSSFSQAYPSPVTAYVLIFVPDTVAAP
ncbi:hypothetical protein Micbo1qcDRAFT_54834 [Microdochium bolleyi]|uniref:Uncharacterized protein n=1 Tax=Microdochium bolleyi TaxID=196109 RepID=A0A136J866_9PEZI|nr:hypothetical protein Micbo1qcDRAFT_54834 [Microdochium bolleyi]